MTRHGRSNHLNMLVQPGLRPSNFGDPEQIGVVPYVSRARLIMLYDEPTAAMAACRLQCPTRKVATAFSLIPTGRHALITCLMLVLGRGCVRRCEINNRHELRQRRCQNSSASCWKGLLAPRLPDVKASLKLAPGEIIGGFFLPAIRKCISTLRRRVGARAHHSGPPISVPGARQSGARSKTGTHSRCTRTRRLSSDI
jgi:hypothetical protein